ncbi:MAG: protease complex subunit PrcB family protein [Caldilineaceae bacterium]|nr:protease complex subunit PrcB family protein [Caldilineaceae bacterium]
MSPLNLRSFIGMLCFLAVTMACQSMQFSSPLQPGEVEVPFETIVAEEWGGAYESEEPRVFLLTEPTAIDQIASLIEQDQLEQLRQADYTRELVVAVFQGLQPSSDYKVVVTRITKQDTLLRVYVQFWQPSSSQGAAPAETSPYHIVKIKTVDLATRPTDVKLVIDVVQP